MIRENERQAFAKSVLEHSEISTRSASSSSSRARQVIAMIDIELKKVAEVKDQYATQIRRFNQKMCDVKEREIRLEDERIDMERKIKENNGKPLDYFKVPRVAEIINSRKSNQNIVKSKVPKGIQIRKL